MTGTPADTALRNAAPTPDRGDDAWLAELLQKDAAAAVYIDDAGFTACVLGRLPEVAQPSRYRWIVPAMGVLGCLIALVGPSGVDALAMTVIDLAQLKAVTASKFLAAALPLGLLYWLAVSAAWQER